MQTATLKYKAKTSRHGHRQLEQAMLHMSLLCNAAIRHRQTATGCHRRAFSLKLQNAQLTDLRKHDPLYGSYSRKLEQAVLNADGDGGEIFQTTPARRE